MNNSRGRIAEFAFRSNKRLIKVAFWIKVPLSLLLANENVCSLCYRVQEVLDLLEKRAVGHSSYQATPRPLAQLCCYLSRHIPPCCVSACWSRQICFLSCKNLSYSAENGRASQTTNETNFYRALGIFQDMPCISRVLQKQ